MAQPRSCGCIPSSGGRASSLASEHLDRRQLDAAARRGPGVHGRAGGQEERVVGSQGRGRGRWWTTAPTPASRRTRGTVCAACSTWTPALRCRRPACTCASVHTRDTAAQQMQRLAGNPRCARHRDHPPPHGAHRDFAATRHPAIFPPLDEFAIPFTHLPLPEACILQGSSAAKVPAATISATNAALLLNDTRCGWVESGQHGGAGGLQAAEAGGVADGDGGADNSPCHVHPLHLRPLPRRSCRCAAPPAARLAALACCCRYCCRC